MACPIAQLDALDRLEACLADVESIHAYWRQMNDSGPCYVTATTTNRWLCWEVAPDGSRYAVDPYSRVRLVECM